MYSCKSCGGELVFSEGHWDGYCHDCCLMKPRYALHLEGEIKRLQTEVTDLKRRNELATLASQCK